MHIFVDPFLKMGVRQLLIMCSASHQALTIPLKTKVIQTFPCEIKAPGLGLKDLVPATFAFELKLFYWK